MKILNRFTGEAIIEKNVETIAELVDLAIKTRVNLTESNLTESNLTKADLTRANLYGANLYGANLTESNLTKADLTGSNLTGSNLTGSNLTGSNLTKADLTGANLAGANLYGANLYGADLTRANLAGANLYGANLRCYGNMKDIFTLQLDTYLIGFTNKYLQIGCKRHTIEEWKNFSDEEIAKMDKNALSWWNKWKEHLFNTISLSLK